MKKRILALLIALVSAFCCIGCGPASEKPGVENPPGGDPAVTGPDIPETVTYETFGSFWMRQHDFKTMPVAAYNACPPQLSDFTHNYLESESTFVSYAEAGVNTMMGLYEYAGSEEALQALDWCAENGLSYLMPLGGAESFTSDSIPKSTLSRAKYHEAFGGIMQMDEPGRTYFEGIARSADIIQSVMPEGEEGYLWHVNLFPTYANQLQLYFRQYTASSQLPEGGYSYAQYIEDYMAIVQPEVLSYDFYPCSGAEGNLSKTYFENMAIIRAAAQEANIPFWTFVQTCSFNSGMRIPTEADILWQVNTALAYGAKGIQYFTGVLPTNGDGTGEIFNGAMFDRDGNRTVIYDYVKTANDQIKAIDEVLMCSRSEGVIVTGAMPWEGESLIPAEDILEKHGKVQSVSAAHALTGCFDYAGWDAYYITNNSVLEEDAVTVTFDGEVKGFSVQRAEKKDFTGSSLSFTLKAGEGVLIVVSA